MAVALPNPALAQLPAAWVHRRSWEQLNASSTLHWLYTLAEGAKVPAIGLMSVPYMQMP